MREQAVLLEHRELVADRRRTALRDRHRPRAPSSPPAGRSVTSTTLRRISSWRGVSTHVDSRRAASTAISASAFRTIRCRPARLSVSTSRHRPHRATVPVTTISCSGAPCRGTGPTAAPACRAAGRLGLRAATGHRPQPVEDHVRQADRLANSSSMWIGLKSPEAPAYDRDVPVRRHLQLSLAGLHGHPLARCSSRSVQTVSPPWLVHRLEDVEAHAASLGDVLDRHRGVDLVAGDDQRTPPELLAAVDHHGEVDPDLRVEERRPDGGRAVDGGEHRRRDDVAVTEGARRLTSRWTGFVSPTANAYSRTSRARPRRSGARRSCRRRWC